MRYPRFLWLTACLGILAGCAPPAPADVAAPRSDAAGQQRSAALLALDVTGPVDVVFLGDSITHAWDLHGKAIWQKYYGTRRVVNLGNAGDLTQNVLWRLEQGQLDKLQPRVIVLLIGTNNASIQSSVETARGVSAVVTALKERAPAATLLLMGIFPRGQQPNALGDRIAATNQLLAKMAAEQEVRFVDLSAEFLQSDGTVRPGLLVDEVHLETAGYEVWAAGIEPQLQTLLTVQPGEQ